MDIEKIEKLTYEEAKKIAKEVIKIKNHDCVFVELGEYFGYSVLVFKNGKYIYYANDYELHHGYLVEKSGKSKLRDFYIKSLNNKLFTDEELLEPVRTYREYTRKSYFLRNYWIMQYDYISIFGIKEEKKIDKAFNIYNPISFCYVKNQEIIDEQTKYFQHLEKEYISLCDNIQTFQEMIVYELENHEACITRTAEDALESLGLSFDELSPMQQKVVKQELKKQIQR